MKLHFKALAIFAVVVFFAFTEAHKKGGGGKGRVIVVNTHIQGGKGGHGGHGGWGGSGGYGGEGGYGGHGYGGHGGGGWGGWGHGHGGGYHKKK